MGSMQVKFFGIARDIVGASKMEVSSGNAVTYSVADLKRYLVREFPKFAELSSFAVAVNSEYALDDLALAQGDEVAIIPPVSGG